MSFFGEVISREGLQPDLKKLYALTEMSPLIEKYCGHF